ncbi:MAG TPA: hypothetical protein VKH18_08745 [Terriglobales bacterium]|nr:hypothetical protein [Terriglobales bacterium]
MSVRKFGSALLLGLCFSVYASASCSNATLAGNYGFTLTGVDSTGSLASSVGQLTADGLGNFTGTFTNSTAGVISLNNALTGTYSVNKNCTGTTTLTPSGGTASVFTLVVVSAGAQFEMTDTKAGSSEYGYALAQGKAICTNAGIKNTFGFRGGGYDSSLAPYAWAGQVKLDGLGGVTGSETASFGGTIQTFTLTGTYSVSSNCTGTATFNGGPTPANTYFVIVNAGKSAMQIQTDANTIFTNFVQK